MTTPANRAPKFVVMDKGGDVVRAGMTESEARTVVVNRDLHWASLGPHTVHPIGPAVPGPGRDGDTPGAALYNAMTPGSPIAWVYLPENHRALWETRATAVIAAHEAGRETERLKNAIAPVKSATKKCVVCGAALNESGPYSQKYCGRSCLSEDEDD